MKVNDLFKRDFLNPKPIYMEKGDIQTTNNKDFNFKVLLVTLLFGITAIYITSNNKTYGTKRKEN
jgi:hypothetical protein